MGRRHIVGAGLPLGAFTAWAPSDAAETVQLVRGVIESLTAPPGQRVMVGVDDVHLLDDLSTFVVHQIVQRRAAKVVLTVRDGEPFPPRYRRYGRAASSSGSICGRCRATKPPRCCRRRWAAPWTRMRRRACGS